MPVGQDGLDFDAVMTALRQWVSAGTKLAIDKCQWSQQKGPRQAEPAINMRLEQFDDLDQPWLDTVSNPLVLNPVTVTGVSGNVMTAVAHGLQTGDGPVVFTGAALPAPISALGAYWVVVVDADHFSVASNFINAKSPSPTVITLTSSGSGSIVLTSVTTTVRPGQELLYISRSLIPTVLQLTAYTADATGPETAVALLRRLISRSSLPSVSAILDTANIGLTRIQRIRAIHGVKDSVLFEPRALLDVHLSLASQEAEYGTTITSIEFDGTISGYDLGPKTVSDGTGD